MTEKCDFCGDILPAVNTRWDKKIKAHITPNGKIACEQCLETYFAPISGLQSSGKPVNTQNNVRKTF